jgi:ABC-type phosphate transport system substrate-binding protein
MYRRAWIWGGISLLLLPLTTLANDPVVVVNAETSIESVSRSELQHLYLGRTKTVKDVEVEAVNLPENHPLREEFHQKVIGRNREQMSRYWARALFTGTATPPKTVQNEKEVVEVVSDRPAVGYISTPAEGEAIREVDLQ